MRTDWSDEGQTDGGKSKQKAIVTVQVEIFVGKEVERFLRTFLHWN